MNPVEFVQKLTASSLVRIGWSNTQKGLDKIRRLLRRWQLGAVGRFLIAGAIDRHLCDTYPSYQSWRHRNAQEIVVRGQQMIFNLDD